MSDNLSTNRLKQNGADFWNENPCGGNWSSYRQFISWMKKTEPYLFEILDKYDWKDKKVIEVGCGQGTTLNYLPMYGAHVVGLDMSYQSLMFAQSGAEELHISSNVELLAADAENLPLADGDFDVAISCGVLHHTVNTMESIRQLQRMLKPGGTAIVMLYRSGNPKWWMTKSFRGFSKLIDKLIGEPGVIVKYFRQRQKTGSPSGTAHLELFGVPILKAFSNNMAKAMFADFSEVHISNHQPGFRRLVDIVSVFGFLEPMLAYIDRKTQSVWGFYQVIEARK